MARTFQQYVTHLKRFGPEGLLAAARRDLDEAELEKLERLVKAAQKLAKGRRG